MSGWQRVAGAALVVGLILAAPAVAQRNSSVSEEDLPLIKAAMIYNICKFVTWPEDPADDDFVLGLVGVGDGGPDFKIVAGKPIHEHPLTIIEVTSPADLRRCRVVFVADAQHLGELHASARKLSLLTIGDDPGFAAGGGIVELVYDESRLRFIVNQAAARGHGLELSSQLLKIAKKVMNLD